MKTSKTAPLTAAAPRRKLAVGPAGDAFEREADHVADQVMRMPAGQTLHRKCATCEDDKVRRKSTGPDAPGEAPPMVRQVLSAPGRPLDTATRAFMEPRFGRDFGDVRVHSDETAARSANAVAAQAYTVGSTVVFGAGRYAPHTAEGRHLLAHELAHVVQQAGGELALQRRAANCPKDKLSPPVVKTMADFIELVKRVEASSPSGKDPIATAKLISRTKYDGMAWDWMLPSTKGQKGAEAGGAGSVTSDDIASLCFKLIVDVPGGGQEDPMHVVIALVADAETKAPGTGAKREFLDDPLGAVKDRVADVARPLPASVSQRSAVTWAGDVGKAAAYWIVGLEPKFGCCSTMADFMKEDAPPHDLMGDVDGVALTAKSTVTGATFDKSKPLSENLQNYFNPATHVGRERRFHVFCGAEGFALESDGTTLSAAAKDAIRLRVKDFAEWAMASDPKLISEQAAKGEGGGALAILKRQNDHKWFADQFIDFVQSNLTKEGK